MRYDVQHTEPGYIPQGADEFEPGSAVVYWGSGHNRIYAACYSYVLTRKGDTLLFNVKSPEGRCVLQYSAPRTTGEALADTQARIRSGRLSRGSHLRHAVDDIADYVEARDEAAITGAAPKGNWLKDRLAFLGSATDLCDAAASRRTARS